MVVAAVARGSKDNAASLLDLHRTLLPLLHDVGIFPISMSADGTEVERSLQTRIEGSATRVNTYVIPNPVLDNCQLRLHIYFQDGDHPFVTLQDPNHARKTGRNQVFTGARVLGFGAHAIYYAQLRDCVIGTTSPLFHRDVEKVDRQDDRAAARLTSSAFLAHVGLLHPDRKGLLVYLFVLGEIIDAWQNRSISHLERATMVMMARFVFMAWRTHVISHPAYSLNVQFISRESFDIFTRICDGLLTLIILHRQYHPTHPLLPWLHGTENCEHIFGTLRQLKTDFNYMDFLYLQPKLRTLILSAFSRLVGEKAATATAAGYYHSYILDAHIDLHALSTWPTDTELESASGAAYRSAETLLEAVGINANAMLSQYQTPRVVLTSDGDAQSTLTFPRGPATLAELIALYDATAASVPIKQQEEIEACHAALVSDSIDKTLHMYVHLFRVTFFE